MWNTFSTVKQNNLQRHRSPDWAELEVQLNCKVGDQRKDEEIYKSKNISGNWSLWEAQEASQRQWSKSNRLAGKCKCAITSKETFASNNPSSHLGSPDSLRGEGTQRFVFLLGWARIRVETRSSSTQPNRSLFVWWILHFATPQVSRARFMWGWRGMGGWTWWSWPLLPPIGLSLKFTCQQSMLFCLFCLFVSFF